MNWLGISSWDDEPYIQSKRIKLLVIKKLQLDLLENNKAFKCICKQEELEKKEMKILKKNTNALKDYAQNCENDHDVQN